MAKKKETSSAKKELKWWERAFKLDIRHLNSYKHGFDKFVFWRNGIGLLNIETVGRQKMAWVQVKDGVLQPAEEAPFRNFDDYIKYWERRGAKAEEITADKAEKLLRELEKTTIKVSPEVAGTPKEAAKSIKDKDIVLYICEKCGVKFEHPKIDGAAGCPQCGNKSGVLFSKEAKGKAKSGKTKGGKK